MEKLPVTVVVPILNEEQNLSACLERLKRFAAVYVVDSGSTDRSRSIATEYGATVIDFEWDGKFPKKRNWFLRNHELDTPWVLFLDADEYVSEAFVDELEEILPHTSHDGFWINFENYFMNRLLKHGDQFRKLPLFRLGKGEYERIDESLWTKLDMEVHEHPIVEGSVGELKSPIVHRDYKGLEHYIARHNAYSSWEARRYLWLKTSDEQAWNKLNNRQKRKYSSLTKWWFAPAYFFFCYFKRQGFRDGKAGFHLALHKMIYFYQIRLKILEIERNSDSQT